MKVLIVHEIFLPEFSGGGEIIMYELAKGLKEKGFEVEVITSGDPKIKEYRGIKTFRVWFPGKMLRRYLFNFLAFPFVLKKGKDCDLIHTTTYNSVFPSYLAAKILGKPIVCTMLGLYGKKWKEIRPEFFERLGIFAHFSTFLSFMFEKVIAKLDYDKIILLSRFSKKILKEMRGSVKNAEIVMPGVYHQGFKKRRKKKYVLFVGRLEKQKGFDILIKVAKKLSDINFLVVGSTNKLNSKIRKILPKNVKLLGTKFGKSLRKLYEEALIFFLPSRAETLGLVILEAMAAGCAIVSTVPLNYKGFKIKENESVESIAKKIEFLIKNEKVAREWGEENRKIGKKYSWKNFVEKIVKIYEEILKDHNFRVSYHQLKAHLL